MVIAGNVDSLVIFAFINTWSHGIDKICEISIRMRKKLQNVEAIEILYFLSALQHIVMFGIVPCVHCILHAFLCRYGSLEKSLLATSH